MLADGAWIHVEQIQFFVGHDLKNVRMAANKKFGWILVKQFAHAWCVSPGITANMGDENVYLFAHKSVVFREFQTGFGIINITVNSSKWF